MRFSFVAKHRGIWPVSWICEALGVSRSGFHAWLNRSPSRRAQYDEVLVAGIRSSFAGSDRTYGAWRVWHDVLAEGLDAGLHRIERLMRQEGLRARPRRRGLPKDAGQRHAVSPNILDRAFVASAPNQKWIADFTYIWTAQGWLYVAAVVDLYSRRVVGWSMSSSMAAQLVTDALIMAIWRRGKPDSLLHHSDQGSQYTSEQFQRLMADHGITCLMSRSGMSGTTRRWKASSHRSRPNAPPAKSIAPGTMPRPMCSTISSASATRGADTRHWAISAPWNTKSNLS